MSGRSEREQEQDSGYRIPDSGFRETATEEATTAIRVLVTVPGVCVRSAPASFCGAVLRGPHSGFRIQDSVKQQRQQKQQQRPDSRLRSDRQRRNFRLRPVGFRLRSPSYAGTTRRDKPPSVKQQQKQQQQQSRLRLRLPASLSELRRDKPPGQAAVASRIPCLTAAFRIPDSEVRETAAETATAAVPASSATSGFALRATPGQAAGASRIPKS